jgi:hypothetical protein
MRQPRGLAERWARAPVRVLRGVRRRSSQGEGAAEPGFTVVEGGDRDILERCAPFTMTSAARLQALVDAVAYCERRGVRGAFVECGVWQGGSVLAMLLKLQELGEIDRDVYLYDTFEGMTAPTDRDTSRFDGAALTTWQASTARGERAWPELFAPDVFQEDAVRTRLSASGYPEERLHLVRGPVEETIPAQAPDEVALLRLDTDWYESTHHELVHLYPRLCDGGVLIIDDYGHWDGARQAVDEYFSEMAEPILLNRIDYTGRVGIKH